MEQLEQKASWEHEDYLKTHHIKYTTNLKRPQKTHKDYHQEVSELRRCWNCTRGKFHIHLPYSLPFARHGSRQATELRQSKDLSKMPILANFTNSKFFLKKKSTQEAWTTAETRINSLHWCLVKIREDHI